MKYFAQWYDPVLAASVVGGVVFGVAGSVVVATAVGLVAGAGFLGLLIKHDSNR